MSVDTIRVSIPLKLSDVAHFERLADPIRFFKVDTRSDSILWTKHKGLAEFELPSHSRGIHWDLREPKPGEIHRMMDLHYLVLRKEHWVDKNKDLSIGVMASRSHVSSAFRSGERVTSVFVGSGREDGIEFASEVALDPFKMLDLELSLPKLLRGHNIELLHNPVDALYFLKGQLEEVFDFILPDLDWWFCSRLDVCHAYRFQTQEIAQLVIDGLKNKKFPHKKATIYDTSIHYPGKEYTFKIYLKQPEYKANSLRKDFKIVGERADSWWNYAAGVLRIEMGLKNGALSKVTGEKYHILSDVFRVDENGEFLYNSLLKAAYVKYFGEGEILNEEDLVSERFKAYFKTRKANEMMKLWCMVQYMGEKKARKHMGENTWYTYKRDLAECGVQNTPTVAAALHEFSFQIPHPLFTINHDDSDLKGLYQAHGILPFDEEDEEVPRKRA